MRRSSLRHRKELTTALHSVRQASPLANGHAGGATSNMKAASSAVHHNGGASVVSPTQDPEAQDDGSQAAADPSAQSLKLDAWTPRSQRGQGVDGNGGEPWRAVWSGLWPGKENAVVVREEDGEVIMTV
jgi:hypothetical protein